MKTDVIFKKFKDDNSIIAVFYNEDYFHYKSSTKMSYMHIGQHSACELDHTSTVTVLATPKEYKDLKNELISIGYNLNILNTKLNFNF